MICSCCNNQYDDNLNSCPFCGTAKAISSPSGMTCPGCGSPVASGQAMCAHCGWIEPSRNIQSPAPTMPNVGDDLGSAVRFEGASNNMAPSQNAYSQPNTINSAQSAYNQTNTPYSNTQNNPYSQPNAQQYTPYQQNTYGQYPQQNPYQNYQGYQNPYQMNPNDPQYIKETGTVRTQAIIALVFSLILPLVTYILAAVASSKAKKLNYTGSNTIITIALVIAILNSLLGIIMQFSQ